MQVSKFPESPPSIEQNSENATLLTPKPCPQASLKPETNKFSIVSSSKGATYGNAIEKLDLVNETCSTAGISNQKAGN